MYTGIWKLNTVYKTQDIVFTGDLQCDNSNYYICIKSHESNALTYPNKEDLYWLHLPKDVLNNEDDRSICIINQNHPRADWIHLSKDILTQIKNEIINNNKNSEKLQNENENELKNQPKLKFKNRKPNIKIIINNKLKKIKDQNSNEESEDQNKYNTSTSDDIRQGTENEENVVDEKCYSDCGDTAYLENIKKNDLKRKLRSIEIDVEQYKRKKTDDQINSLRDQLLLMDIDIGSKSFMLDKYENSKKMTSSDYSKTINWLKTACKIPYGKFKKLPINKTDDIEKIKQFFINIKNKLDESIHGLEIVKQEILEFVARKITNPDGKGHVLALYGHPGVGKSKIIKSLADALDFPFYQINFGGLNDASIITGHSETYVGSKPGKIVEILNNSDYMNPIIYLDEVDKISQNKSTEIFGILTHLLDEEQNNKFQDNYLSNISIDLSKVFFVLAFNDLSKIDEIVSNRLKIIYIDPPSVNDKIIIAQDKMIPDIIRTIGLKNTVCISKEIIEYIIVSKTKNESGVRQLRKNIENILNRLNYDLLIQNTKNFKIENDVIIITKTYVDITLKQNDKDVNNTNYLNMYI